MTNLPVTGAFRVTCEYGRRGDWSYGYHKGIDLYCDNLDVYCTCDGTVKTVGWDPDGWGRYVRVDDGNGRIHIFCHLVRDSVRVSVGQKVSRLSVLGTMGTTGNSTGVHLHYQIEDAYRNVYDPTSWLGIPNAVGSYHSENYQIGESAPAQTPEAPKAEVKEEVSVLDQFNDKASISGWAAASVEKAVKKGIYKGTDKGNLEPGAPVTREQLAVILDRLGLLG